MFGLNLLSNLIGNSRLKYELIYGDKLMTEKELGIKIFEYI